MYILYKVTTFTLPNGSHCTAPGRVGAYDISDRRDTGSAK
jgi:hypothetical protein